MDAAEAARAIYLAELALASAVHLLKPKSAALIKLQQGARFQEFVAAARRGVCEGAVSRARGIAISPS